MYCLCSAEQYKISLAPIFPTFDISEEGSIESLSQITYTTFNVCSVLCLNLRTRQAMCILSGWNKIILPSFFLKKDQILGHVRSARVCLNITIQVT